MTITIGKAQSNDFVINNPHVSRFHARLIEDETGCWILEDLESANGSFVNGVQIARKRVVPTDTIILGKDYELDFRAVLKCKNDYSVEFNALKKIYDDYTREKVRIQSSNQFKTRLFQSLPFALPGIIGLVVTFAGDGNRGWFLISLLFTVLAPVIGIYFGARQSAKIPQQLQDLTNQFKIDYVCPKCGTFLGDIPWESLRNKKHCPIPSCQAKWVNK